MQRPEMMIRWNADKTYLREIAYATCHFYALARKSGVFDADSLFNSLRMDQPQTKERGQA